MRFFAQRTLLPLLAAFALLAGACSTPPEEQPAPDTPDASSDRGAGDETTADPATEAFAGPIEAAQGAAAWHTHDAVQAALRVELGGNTVLTGDLTFRTDGTGSRVATADGKVTVWDGETAWVSPADAEMPQARFHVLTWPYFFAVPFKLRDPGTHLEDLGELPFRDTALPAARLTFDGAVGDTPDDWYVLYRDAATSRLAGMGYVVTYGRSLEEAEAEPHAISYGDFVDVDGVQVPTTWQFWHWSREKGVSGEPIGRATLTDVRFVTPATDAFTAPEGAEEATLPDAG
jgi:hypothetical protein